jgi:hypothetical protein
MTKLNSGDTSSWDHARAYAQLLGKVPSSFTTAIRQLKADHDKGIPMSRATAFQAGRLCRSPSLSASLMGAAKSYFPEIKIQEEAQLVQHLPIDSIAGLLGTAFYYFRVKKLANYDEWTQYAKGLPNRVELGGAVGKYIPRIGVSRGILAGAFDTIALTAFHLHDKKGFTDYRRFLKNKSKREDLTYENDRWGCTRYNVASILIQTLGFGVEFANSYAVGMLATDSEEKSLFGDAYCFRLTRIWIDALDDLGCEPDRAMRVEYYPDAAELSLLRERASRLLTAPLSISWLDKTKKDVEHIEDSGESS